MGARGMYWGHPRVHNDDLTQPRVCRNHTCVPENRESTVCLCNVLMDDVVSGDTYQLDLWAGTQLLWSGSFRPSEHGEWGRAGFRGSHASWARGGGRPQQPLTTS